MPLQTCAPPFDCASLSSSVTQVSGCQPWVLQQILETTNLRMWKLSALAAGSLNVVELANKASVIRHAIEHRQSVNEPDGDGTGSAVLQITEVFATAAVIYLHTTTSGAYPGVSDIRNAVSKMVAVSYTHLTLPTKRIV